MTSSSAVPEPWGSLTAVRELLPRGGRLSDPEWWSRHRFVTAVLWVHAAGLGVLGVTVGANRRDLLLGAASVAALAVPATFARHRGVRTCMATAGLVTSSAVLVHLSHGAVAAHFHLLVVTAAVTLYGEWLPVFIAGGFVGVYHGIFGLLDPAALYDDPAAPAARWEPAVVHLALVLGAGAATITAWRVSERAAEARRTERRLFREAFENAPEGMALVGLDGRWLRANRALCEITGYSEHELTARTVQDIMHPDDHERDLEEVEKVLSGAGDGYRIDRRCVRADGEMVPIRQSVTVVRDSAGVPDYLISHVADISQEREAEEHYRRLYEGERALVRQLDDAHRLKSELFNIVSHEFKTPLAGIIGFAGLLAKGGDRLGGEQRESYLQTIARQAERLNRLVENLFVSAREVHPPQDAVADVAQAIDAVRAQLADSYDDVGFEMTMASGLEPRISQEALRLVLLNLASNAVKHAAPDTTVEVVGTQEGDAVVIAVSNEGDPVPEELRERIFEPFVQSSASSRTADGVGLGLHIVRKLVTAYGGSVTLQSSRSTVTFTVRLPSARSRGTREVELRGAPTRL
jgi:PAS domain S-box-containing protein